MHFSLTGLLGSSCVCPSQVEL